MTKLVESTAFAFGVFALVACGDQKPPPKPRVHLALLGKKSETVIAHFESTCPGRVIHGDSSLSCFLPNHVHYRIAFDHKHERISVLEIYGTLADARPIYDRAFAPIVPDETRELLRQSLRESQGVIVFRKSGGEVAMSIDVKRARDGHAVRIAWSMVDLFGDYAPVP